MMFNPRLLAGAVASLCTAALILSSCGDLTPDSLAFATDDEDTSPESVIRIAATRVAGLERAIDDWEREHPTARVEVVVRSVNDHHVSVLDDAGAGGTFDIIAFEASYGPEIRQRPELFVDLRELGGDAAEPDLLDTRWDEGVAVGGELIGLPIDVDSVALAVRTDLVGEELVEELRSASSWCQLIAVGDAFSDASGIAFVPDGDELFTTMMSQNRLSFVDDTGFLLSREAETLRQVWDLSMLAIGNPPVHGSPCPEENGPADNEIARIARNLPSGEEQWRTALRDDGFAAVFARYSDLREIAIGAPETSESWTIIELPGPFGSSAGGTHLGLSAATTHRALAFDLISYLADPVVQRASFADGSGSFPAAAVLYDEPMITEYSDPFFGGAPIGEIYAAAAERRPTELADPVRRIVLEEFTAALNRVEQGHQTPLESWDEAIWRIGQILA